jgi:hypothetical protein
VGRASPITEVLVHLYEDCGLDFLHGSTVGAVTFRHHAGFTLVYDDNFPNKEEDRSGALGTVEEKLWT